MERCQHKRRIKPTRSIIPLATQTTNKLSKYYLKDKDQTETPETSW